MAQAGVERDDRGGPMGEIVTLRDQGLGNACYLVDLGDGRGLVLDPSRDPGPYLDAVARTDLISPDRTQQLARALWRSLHQRVLTLPDDLGVYPTHGAGSFCSAPTGTAPTTTIAREKATNPLLAAPDEDTFVKLLVG